MMSARPLISGLGPDAAERAGREILRFNQRLADSELFSDAALARLLDDHPRDEMTICTMSPNPAPDELWIAGEARGLSGAELLEAVKHGRLWISPRNAMNTHPAYRPVLDRLIAEFSAATGVRVLTAEGSVLISSPRMGVFVHVDMAETMLWHLRGSKTIHIYPAQEEHVAEQALEAILLKETLSDLPYSPRMEAGVRAVELAPGEAVHWPLHSPHRVTNGEDLNVSVSFEFSSPRSVLENGVLYTNGVLRRRLGLSPVSRTTPQILKPAYWAAAKMLKTLAPPRINVLRDHARRFDVDLSAPGCVRWREGQEPSIALAA